MNNFSKRVSQVHGIFLIIFTSLLFIYINLVPYYAVGPYAFLSDNFWGTGGLSQAYMLMACFGLSLWIGAGQATTRVWNWMGALPHLIFLPLYAIGFSHLYNDIQGMAIAGLVLHFSWAAIELVAALNLLPFGKSTERVRA